MNINIKNAYLLNAAERSNWELVRMLIGRGVDVNIKDMDGMTSLHCAAKNSCSEVTAWLKEHGANIKMPWQWGLSRGYETGNLSGSRIKSALFKSSDLPSTNDQRLSQLLITHYSFTNCPRPY